MSALRSGWKCRCCEVVIVINGLMIRHGGQVFVIPFEHIREITQLDQRDLRSLPGFAPGDHSRSGLRCPRLHTILDVPIEAASEQSSQTAVLVGTPQGEVCLLVDQVLGNRKVVVNGIEEYPCPVRTRLPEWRSWAEADCAVISVPEVITSLTALPGLA